VQRKKERRRKREESEEEKEEGKEKEKERFLCVSLAHAYMRAYSNRNVVFLLSQVSHAGRKSEKNQWKKEKFRGNPGKHNEERRVFFCGSECFWGRFP